MLSAAPEVWRPRDAFGERFPAGVRGDLLATRSSMTAALRRLCDGGFRLRVVAEHPVSLDAYQRGELAGDGGTVREVLMGCERTAWLFAQTLVPEPTLAACPWLAELGDRPLGDALFARDDVERSDFLYALLDDEAPLCRRIRDVLPDARPGPRWARRSYFFVAGRALLVNEVFLSGD